MEPSLEFLSMGAWISRALAVAAHFGIADFLADGPATKEELANATGVHPDAVQPLLKALIGVGVFAENENGSFTNSPLSERLRTDHPESVRHLVQLLGGLYFKACGGLLESAKTGKSALPFVFGAPLYEVLEQDPAEAEIFDRAMQERARPIAVSVAKNYPFENARTVIDVGGGNGELLKGILSVHPHLKGICLDRPVTCERAEASLLASGNEDLIERLSYRPTDIFSECPSGGDIYIIKNVLHDWSSDSAVRLLTNIRDAMSASAAASDGDSQPPMLLIIDAIAEHDVAAPLRPLIKLVFGEDNTRDRSEADIRRETAEAGLEVQSIKPSPPENCVVACTLAPSTVAVGV
jgi:C-methyltransferase